MNVRKQHPTKKRLTIEGGVLTHHLPTQKKKKPHNS
jgi:hypothetical protein